MLVLHAGIAGPGNVADFLFQVAYADTKVCQFICVFPCQFVQGCLLFCVQLVFAGHQTGDNLSQFITGHVSFAFECAVRIPLYNALIGKIGYSLVGPIIGGYIREWICSVCGYACGECSCCCDCENLFHDSSSFEKKLCVLSSAGIRKPRSSDRVSSACFLNLRTKKEGLPF